MNPLFILFVLRVLGRKRKMVIILMMILILLSLILVCLFVLIKQESHKKEEEKQQKESENTKDEEEYGDKDGEEDDVVSDDEDINLEVYNNNNNIKNNINRTCKVETTHRINGFTSNEKEGNIYPQSATEDKNKENTPHRIEKQKLIGGPIIQLISNSGCRSKDKIETHSKNSTLFIGKNKTYAITSTIPKKYKPTKI